MCVCLNKTKKSENPKQTNKQTKNVERTRRKIFKKTSLSFSLKEELVELCARSGGVVRERERVDRKR